MGWLKSLNDLLVDDIERQKLVTIDFPHHQIHDECTYSAEHEDSIASAGNSLTLYLKAPDTAVRIHLVASVSTGNEGDFELRESATVSLSGTVLTAFNRDRNSSNTSPVTVRHTPTITASGTRLGLVKIGSTGKKESVGGATSLRNERILKQGTIYLLRFTSKNNDTEVSIDADWYEV